MKRYPYRRSFVSACLLVLLTALSAPAFASIAVSSQPDPAGRDDRIVLRISNCRQGGVLHWGVNAKAHAWQSVHPAYRPAGSTVDGTASRTRLSGPDSNGVCEVSLGPFNRPEQPVFSLDYVIQWDDGTWSNNEGHDYHVPIHNRRISFAPEQPTINNSVVVTVRQSRPGGQLRWGINETLGKWRRPVDVYRPAGSVPSDDGMAIDSPLPPPDAHGESILLLGPFNRAEQVVTSLHAAVHWGNDWDSDFGRNYNLSIRPSPQTEETRLTIEEPLPGAEYNASFTARFRASVADSIHVWLDGQSLAILTQRPFRIEMDGLADRFGLHTLTARCGDETNAQVASVDFWYAPDFEWKTERPSWPLGFSFADDRAHFALLAPGKHFVQLLMMSPPSSVEAMTTAGVDRGSSNPSLFTMNCSTDGVWWTERPLPPGRYRYQYLIDGRMRLADPYSLDVDWQDEKGEETYLPERAFSIIDIPPTPFAWTDQDFKRPAPSETIIYELSIDDFTAGSGFTGLLARLDYLQDLGINAIEPMPFHEFAGRWSWGYNPSFHFAPETSHGTPDQLRQLVDEAHRRGMAVIMDTVLNHMDWNSPLHQLYGVDYESSPYFRLFEGDNWGFPDLEQENPAFKAYAADLTRFWIERYHIDGFRYDATRWTGWQGYNDWGASWFACAAKQADAESLQIAEHLPTDPDLMNRTEMDAGWHGEFRWSLKDMLRNARLDPNGFHRLMNPISVGFTGAAQVVIYTESHDEERIMKECLDAGYSMEEAVRRAETALALTLTAPGVPMLYAGQEFGESTPKVVGYSPLHWNQLNEPRFKRLHESTRKLIALRKTNPSLREDARTLIQNDANTSCAIFSTTNPPRVLVAVNFSRSPCRLSLPSPLTASWQDLLESNSVPADLPIDLAPGQSRVFVE